jgi:MinD-like ATPase involved in chromosome partitioning or flagellar assembly
LRSLGAQTDVVLVDAGHGMSPWVQRWWRAAQQVFLIATEEEAVVKESYLAVKLAPWGDADGKVRLVVNQCDDRQSAERITNRFSVTCRRFLGLHVEGAPPVACSQGETEGETFTADASVAFRHSVRLLATEIISHNVVVSGRVASRQTNQGERQGERLADMIAVAEKSSDSSNKPQTVPHE